MWQPIRRTASTNGCGFWSHIWGFSHCEFDFVPLINEVNRPDVSIALFSPQTIGKKLPPATSTPDPSKTEMDSRTKSEFP
jgi:hypothetical protein